jgi:glucose-6-phosphate 1-dehydrogenase
MLDLRRGCVSGGKSTEDTAPADALVLFGAMGDLARKKIFPALYHMVRHGHLDVPVIGVARAGRTNEHLQRTRARKHPAAKRRRQSESLGQVAGVGSVCRGRLRETCDLRSFEENAWLGQGAQRTIWQFHPISLQASSNLSLDRAP